MEILCMPLQRFYIKLNLLLLVSLPVPAPPWAAFSQGTSGQGVGDGLALPILCQAGREQLGAPQGSEPRRQALLFLEESANTMRKALNGERRL